MDNEPQSEAVPQSPTESSNNFLTGWERRFAQGLHGATFLATMGLFSDAARNLAAGNTEQAIAEGVLLALTGASTVYMHGQLNKHE